MRHVRVGCFLFLLLAVTPTALATAVQQQAAIDSLKKTIAANPNDVDAHTKLGNLLFDIQRYDEAEKSYRRVLELNPKDSNMLRSLGSVLHNQGKKDEAVRYYREYLSTNPDTKVKTEIEARIRWLESIPGPTLLGHLLIYAAEAGDLYNLNTLIAKGADVNFHDPYYRYKSPLNMAAAKGHVPVVETLLARGAKDEEGAALVAAYSGGHTELESLLERLAPKPLTPQIAERFMYAALGKSDAQRLASVVDLVSRKERDDFLLYALSRADKEPLKIVRVLLDKGANVNQPTNSKTALMHAANKGYKEIVNLLLARGAQVNAQTEDGTALMQAVTSGHAEIMKILLAAGADVKAVHRMGDQALIMAAEQRSYSKPAAVPNAEIVELLLAHGADPNARGEWKRTALMLANTAAKVKLLVAKGAEIDVTDEYGQTALMQAASRGEPEVVSALLDSGANVNATDNKGLNALLYSLDDENIAHGEDHKTLPARRLEAARRILLSKSLDVNTQNADGETALMRAVRLENVDAIKLLLARGADVNRSDVFGDTASTIAYAKSNVEIETLLPLPLSKRQPANVLNAMLRAAIEKKDEPKVKELLAAGADPNHEYGISYHHKKIKRTVLILAAGVGHPGIVQALLNKGANVSAQGLIYGSESGLKYGTALEVAERSNHAEVARLLKKVRQD
jgi:uncharacterized protein